MILLINYRTKCEDVMHNLLIKDRMMTSMPRENRFIKELLVSEIVKESYFSYIGCSLVDFVLSKIASL